MWIMIAGPYSSGAKTETARAENLQILNQAALAVFDMGHIPIIGVNLALPVIEQAESNRFDDIMMPMSLALADKCDACLRIGGYSLGADKELDKFRERGLPVFTSLAEITPV